MTDPTPSAPSLSLSRRDASTSTEHFSESFFRRIAGLALSALDVPVFAIRFNEPATLWVATQGDGDGGATLSAQLQESTLFKRLGQEGDTVIDDLWAQERFTALVDLEQFAYRFFASVPLRADDGEDVGQLCVLDSRKRELKAHHSDVLHTLAEMAQSEMQRQREAARRRRGEALQDRLQRVLQMIARDEPIAVTLEALMYLVETQLPGLAATMHWLDPEGLLRPVAAPSVPTALVDATDGLPADAEAGSIGAAIHDGEEVIDQDLTAGIYWPDMRAAVDAAGFVSSWSFPVRSSEGQAVLGAVTLLSPEPLTPTDEMRQTVEIAAQIAAVALERDRDRSLLERMQERHRRFMSQCGEGVYRVELNPAVSVDQPIEEQIKHVFERAHIAECNDAFAQQHGFTEADDLLGRPLLDLYGDGQDLAQLPILRAVDHGYVLDGAESCEIDQQGRQRWFQNRVQGVVEGGALVAFWGAQRDVTKQKHTEYALRESQHRYRTLVDLDPNLVMVHAKDEIQFINPAGARLLGDADPDTIQGRSLSDFVGARARERLVERARRPENTLDSEYFEYEITCLDGRSRFVEIASCHILHGGQPAVLSVAHDVTGRRLYEEGLRSAKQQADAARIKAEEVSQLKSAFMANMNHEIRTPLTAIIGFAEILGEEIENPQPFDVHELVDHIRSNGQRLLWTLDSILNLSRMEAGTLKLRPMPLDVVTETNNLVETFDIMAREKEVALDVQAEQPTIHATLDRVVFERVVGNLLANTIRGTDTGTITLTVSEGTRGPQVSIEAPHLSRGTTRSAGASGAGDAPDALFDGSVSMEVVKGLMKMIQADLSVEEQVDEGGTVFTIRFDSADDVALRTAMHLLPKDAASAA